MIRSALLVLGCMLTACRGCDSDTSRCAIIREGIARCPGWPDTYPSDALGPCNLFTQAGCAAGEKCTWLLDALLPQYVGHIGCAPDGTANTGDACMYGPAGASGYDGCIKGLVCSDHRGERGECKRICDQQGGQPQCDAQHVCVTYPELFDTGDTTPPAAGICEPACDPFADNDFDGSGSASAKTGIACGSNADIGCYGYPSLGLPPATAWACMRELHWDLSLPGLRHRVQCSESNGCAGPGQTFYLNSCNQGYLPLLRESTTVSTAICTALCEPKDCFAGNCGPSDENRLGEAPHRCTNPDRVGTFDTTANGEHCRFIWSLEIDDNGNFLRSPSSDTVGFCFDHSKYLYDSDNNNTPDTQYPPCASLPDGFGSGSALGAGDLGCVDTTHVQFATGKPRLVDDLRPLIAP